MVNLVLLIARFFSRLRFSELFLLGMSFLYGVGLLVLIQHHSVLAAFDELNVIRIKPIIVGIEYLLYIAIPLVSVSIPVLLVRFACRLLGIKSKIVAVLFVLFLTVLVGGWIGVMFHYFFPYIAASSVNLFEISYLFWKLYFTWSGHLFGFGLIFFGVYGLWRFKGYTLTALCGIIGLIGMVCNVFFFTRDVYVNISQSAAGGLPRFGLITISNPSRHLQYGSGDYAVCTEETTKPCYLLHENEEYVYIAEHFAQENTPLALLLNSVRISKSSVSSFQPLSKWMWIYGGQVRQQNYDLVKFDPIYNLSADLSVHVICTNASETIFLPPETNAIEQVPELRIYSKGFNSNVFSTNMNVIVSTIEPSGTNAIIKIRFSHIKFPWGMSMDEVLKKMCGEQCIMCIAGLPKFNPKLKFFVQDLSIGFNFITSVSIPYYQNLQLTVPIVNDCLQFVLDPFKRL